MDSSELLRRAQKNLPGQLAAMEELAPIVQMMMEGYVSEIEERFVAQGQSWLQVVSNVYAINDLLIEKGLFTEEELRSAVAEAANRVSKAIQSSAEEEVSSGSSIEV